MEQIQIRQPKMPAAQSFIQTLLTFISRIFNNTRISILIFREIKIYSNPSKLLLQLTLILKILYKINLQKSLILKNNKNRKLLLFFINFLIYFVLITWKKKFFNKIFIAISFF